MSGIEEVAPWAVLTAVGGWFGNAVAQWLRSRDSRHSVDRNADAKLEEHRDALTFQLLEAARIELTTLRTELQRLRPMESHILHFEQALNYIEALIFGDGDRKAVERNARAFLKRMRRLQEATGTLANEAQRIDSAVELTEREARARPMDDPGA